MIKQLVTNRVIAVFNDGYPTRKALIVGADCQSPLPAIQCVLLNKKHMIHANNLQNEYNL